MVVTKEVIPPLPPNLTAECPEFELADTGEVTELLQVHAANMGKAHVCASRHKALVDLLDRLKDEDREQ